MPDTSRPEHVNDANAIWSRLITPEGYIDAQKWTIAVAEGQWVGTCRNCGGYLVPYPAVRIADNRTDYEARCDKCERAIIAPFGKTYRHSGLRSKRSDRRPWESKASRPHGGE